MGFAPLMRATEGSPSMAIGLVDGPVAPLPCFSRANLRRLGVTVSHDCRPSTISACNHGTFIAGILVADRASGAPGLCPACTVCIRPIFGRAESGPPVASVDDLTVAIEDCIAAGVRIISLSCSITTPATALQMRKLTSTLDACTQRGILVVAAAGNEGSIGRPGLDIHPWVIGVTTVDSHGNPSLTDSLTRSIARSGVSAYGVDVQSVGATGDRISMSGSSVAVAFVTATLALLWSLFPRSPPQALRFAIGSHGIRKLRPNVLRADVMMRILATLENRGTL